MKTFIIRFFLILLYRIKKIGWILLGMCLLPQLCLTTTVFGQKKIWDKTIGGSKGEFFSIVQQTKDGGYILGGSSNSSISGEKSQKSRGGYDFWVVKLNASGTKEWDSTFGGNSEDYLHSLQPTNDGGYILAGWSSSNKSGDKSQPSKDADYWIVKIDGNGKKIWDKTFGGNDSEGSITLVQPTSDGGYMVGGSSYSGNSGDKTQVSRGGRDYWLVKLQADGTKIWDKTFGGNKEEYLNSVQPTTGDGFILSGTSSSDRSGDKTQASKGDDDLWIVKIDKNGNKIWDKTIGGSGSERDRSFIQQTKDGGYILGGNSNSNISGDKSEPNRGCDVLGNCFSDYWVVKLDASGSKEWDKTFGGDGAEELHSMQQTSDKGFIVAGWSYSGSIGDKTEASKGGGSSDYWIVKLNPDGSKVWDKTIGSIGSDELHSFQQTRDGNFILGGTSWADKSGDKSEGNRGCETFCYSDYWLVKLDNSGNNLGQQISFESIINKTLDDAPFAISATASSGLPVTFRVVSGPAKVKGNLISLTDTGTVSIRAAVAGNEKYLPAEVIRSFKVEAPQQVKKQWDKTLGGDGDEQLQFVQQTSDGGFILVGWSNSSISGDKTQPNDGSSNIWVVKLKADGTKEWDKTLPNYGVGVLTFLQQTREGNYILSGDFNDYRLVLLKADGTIIWDKTFGGSDYDRLTAVLQTRDGGYILGGASRSGIGGDKTEANRGGRDEDGGPVSDYWIVKLNANGKKEWDKTLGGNNWDDLTSLHQTRDGGYILGGNSNSGISGDKSEANKGYPSDYWIVKIKADGTKEWDKTIGSFDENYLVSVQQTNDNNYILGGWSWSGKGGDKSEESKGSADYWVVKLNESGSKIWDRTIGGNEIDFLSSIQQTQDGGYILGGTSSSGISGDKTQARRGYKDFWIVKLNADGGKEWDKTLGGDWEEQLTTVQQVSDGGYILAGSSNSKISGDKSETSRGKADYWIVKLKDEQPLTTHWNLRYGGSGKDNLTSVIPTKDGGYLSGGYTNSRASGDKLQTSQGKNDYWIVKSDKNGKKLWDKRYGGSGEDYLNSIVQTADGGYLLAGSSTSGMSGDKTQESRGQRDYWVIKIDKHGTQLWDKRYGGSGTEELKQVIVMPSGSFILAGTSNSPVSGDVSQASYGGQDYWVIKINPTGKKIWEQRYGGEQDDALAAITLTSDGGFLVGGTSASGSSGTKTQLSQGGKDYWVVRLTGEGTLLWNQLYGGSGEDELMALGSTGTSTGNFFLAGTSTSSKSGNKSQSSQGGKDYWLLKINPTGKKIWDKRYGGSEDEELRTINITPEGGYLLGGSSSSGMSGDKSQASQGASDYWVVKTSSTGVKEWDQRYGGSGKEELRSVLLTSDGGYLPAGRSDSGVSGDRTQPSQGATDYWLVKVAPETKSIVATRESTEAEEPVARGVVTLLNAYPNPFQEQVIISFTLPENQTAILKVFDGQGREVTSLFQGEAKANQLYQVKWGAEKVVGGIYFLQLQTSNKRRQQLKLFLAQ